MTCVLWFCFYLGYKREKGKTDASKFKRQLTWPGFLKWRLTWRQWAELNMPRTVLEYVWALRERRKSTAVKEGGALDGAQ